MSLLRPTALIAAGALSVHEVRYALTGAETPDPAGGHGYLPLAILATAVLMALAGAHFLRRVIGARRGAGAEPAGPRLLTAWLAAATALLAIFVAQELLEGLLATGAAPGAVFASGGWVAAPLALGLGAVIAVALTVARAAVAAAARAAGRSRTPRAPARRCPRTALASRRRWNVLAAHRAWRAPPVAS